jgi:NAD(P)H-dependent flavin oxidoreductase YrpB (nitropropane dioxygenase family)
MVPMHALQLKKVSVKYIVYCAQPHINIVVRITFQGVTIFETAGNNPAPVVKYLKSQGAIVIHKCTTVRHAKSAEKMGVDFLSIDGFECGMTFTSL